MRRGSQSILIAVLLCSLVMFSGCGDDDDGGPGPCVTGGEITLPLDVGNEWYFETETSTGLRQSADTLRITTTTEYEGETFYVGEVGGGGDQDVILLRQEGQSVYYVPELFKRRLDTPAPWGAILAQDLEETLPWKLADFAACAGASWVVAEVDTFIPGVGNATLLFQVTYDGRSTVETPAGDFDDAAGFRLSGGFTAPIEFTGMTQTVWFADGVGLVKQVATEQAGPGAPVETETSLLTGYSLVE
ncbi:MAG: hypothetical protein GF355_06580 [Candidatus Eisenbacteria bacterium]|nr:hypothetical protein [Candidatus Eisenbacteria bacterium]